MSYKIEPGVRIHGTLPEIWVGAAIVEDQFIKLGVVMRITGGIEGKHKRGSLHLAGAALDIGSHELNDWQKDQVLAGAKANLGDDFDLILEDRDGPNEHFHIEWQPKAAY